MCIRDSIGREELDGAPPRMTKGILFHENDAEVLGFEMCIRDRISCASTPVRR